MSAAVQPMPSPYSPTASQIAVAYSVCRSITRAAAKNFYYAFLVLPTAKRQALCAVYAYMRRCDDIAVPHSRFDSGRGAGGFRRMFSLSRRHGFDSRKPAPPSARGDDNHDLAGCRDDLCRSQVMGMTIAFEFTPPR